MRAHRSSRWTGGCTRPRVAIGGHGQPTGGTTSRSAIRGTTWETLRISRFGWTVCSRISMPLRHRPSRWAGERRCWPTSRWTERRARRGRRLCIWITSPSIGGKSRRDNFEVVPFTVRSGEEKIAVKYLPVLFPLFSIRPREAWHLERLHFCIDEQVGQE